MDTSINSTNFYMDSVKALKIEHLTAQMVSIGFKSSNADSFLFLREDCIEISYVDGILLFATNDDIFNKIMTELRNVDAKINKKMM